MQKIEGMEREIVMTVCAGTTRLDLFRDSRLRLASAPNLGLEATVEWFSLPSVLNAGDVVAMDCSGRIVSVATKRELWARDSQDKRWCPIYNGGGS